MITYMLTILLQTQPFPVFGFLKEFDNLEDCVKTIKWNVYQNIPKEKMGCIAIAPLKETV